MDVSDTRRSLTMFFPINWMVLWIFLMKSLWTTKPMVLIFLMKSYEPKKKVLDTKRVTNIQGSSWGTQPWASCRRWESRASPSCVPWAIGEGLWLVKLGLIKCATFCDWMSFNVIYNWLLLVAAVRIGKKWPQLVPRWPTLWQNISPLGWLYRIYMVIPYTILYLYFGFHV